MKRNTFVTACALGALVAAGPALAQSGGGSQPSTSQETMQTLPPAPQGQGGQQTQGGQSAQQGTQPLPQGGTQTQTGQSEPVEVEVETQTGQTEPAEVETQPMQAETTEPTTTTSEVDVEMAGSGPEMQGGFIVRQTQEQLMGSELMDAEVVTSADESLGSVEDILLDTQGRVLGVVVGVGGFLGIGEKQVAIPTESLQVMFESEVAAQTEASGQTQPMPSSGQGLASTGGSNIEQIVVDFTREELEQAPDFARLDEEPREEQAETETESEVTAPVESTGSTPAEETVIVPPAGETTEQPRQ